MLILFRNEQLSAFRISYQGRVFLPLLGFSFALLDTISGFAVLGAFDDVNGVVNSSVVAVIVLFKFVVAAVVLGAVVIVAEREVVAVVTVVAVVEGEVVGGTEMRISKLQSFRLSSSSCMLLLCFSPSF